jgi:hypothetical protein
VLAAIFHGLNSGNVILIAQTAQSGYNQSTEINPFPAIIARTAAMGAQLAVVRRRRT